MLFRSEKGVPAELTANEVPITLNSLSRRCDTVVYNRQLRPLAIAEYKAPSVAITQRVFEQIARYNMVLAVLFMPVRESAGSAPQGPEQGQSPAHFQMVCSKKIVSSRLSS